MEGNPEQEAAAGWDPLRADVPGSATVLFVDDEPHVLAGLRRTLHQARPGWRALFADSGAEALRLLAVEPIDVIVADVRMPVMNGAQLLAAVRDGYPGVARLILSGYADQDLVIAAVGPTQQFLSKPVHHEVLAAALDQVLALNGLISDPQLRDLLGGVTALPKPPQIYQRMTAVTADPDYDIDDLVEVIASDLATSAEILRLVNSSFFGLPTRVESVAKGVALLGLSTIQALAVAGGVFASGPELPAGLQAAELTGHAIQVASTVRRITRAEGWPRDAAADLFMAGLLHQIALPVLACAQPEQWAALRRQTPVDVWAEHEQYTEHFGCAPTRASAYLLGLWGFPDTVVHALAEQPAETDATPAALLLTYARHAVDTPHKPFPLPAEGYLDNDRLTRWQAALPQDEPAGIAPEIG